MSRIGRMPITLGAGVEAKLDGNVLTIKGPKGTLSERIDNSKINCSIEGNVIQFTRSAEDGATKAAHGCLAVKAFLMRVSISAMGSVTTMVFPPLTNSISSHREALLYEPSP